MQRIGLWMIRTGRMLAGSPDPSFAWRGETWPSDELVRHAKGLTAQWPQPELSGEYKRHQVFARLIKDYPHENRRALALAIELALLT